ncbi:phage tail protein [Chromobacterium sphagni]|uniref:phage tail protein n=1 Tax=Chromobacterium sphagni TaxID=1903179 RepID=UPI0009F6BD58|nr:phage tail protein [Chromobacterium sphagni]
MTALPIPATPGWPGITRYEVTERLLGGDGGPLNRAPSELLERTEYLKKQIDDIVSGALVAEYADRLKTPRNLAMTGDGSWSVTFDGSGNVSGALTLANSGVTAGSYGMVTVDAKGRVAAGRQMTAADVPALDWNKIASGKPTTLAGYGIADAASKVELQAAIDGVVAGAPGALNTLQKLAAALGNDSNYAATITKQLTSKADKASTLAGYGIADAASKAELQASIDGVVAGAPGALNTLQKLATALGNDSNYAATITKQLTSKADKANTLAGYGIADAASKAELQAAIDGVVAGAPGALNTLQELAAALDNDASFAANLTKKLAGKADKASTLAGYGIADAFPLRADIASAVDLDTLTITGIYHNPANDNAIKGKNWPCPQAGQLTVRATGEMVYHTYQAFADGGFWHRCRYQGRWTVWRQLADAATTQDGITAAAPPGQIAYFARDTPPPGWIICNGAQDVSRTTYAALFAAIGERFGAGDGKTTFGVPDLRGEFIRGWDAGGGVDVAGRSFGSRQASQNLAHDHAIPTPAGNIAGQDTVLVDNGGAPLDLGARQASNELLGEWNGSGRYLRYATYSTGGNESRPRNVALLACIKV